ncbi:MAG: hypothetical protein IJ614_02655 [Prevotella sp.]|nr:hypothetical protein [Prevotella sp.]
MKRIIFLLFVLSVLWPTSGVAQPKDYVWDSPSRNASESMPCGGGDVGMNVWVERGDLLFYLTRSGSFDENNTLLKHGRFRISLSPALDMEHFRQILHLNEGYVEVTDGRISVRLWADVFKPVVHVNVESKREKVVVAANYESWRTRDVEMSKRAAFQSSYKFSAPKGLKTRRDSIIAEEKSVTFFHQNGEKTIFDATVEQQKMETVKARLTNPLKNLVFGGRMTGRGFVFMDRVNGHYGACDYDGWMYVTEKPAQRSHLQIVMAAKQGTVDDWMGELSMTERSVRVANDRKRTQQWWRRFWQRSYVTGDDDICRNYALFRYMLGCNSSGQWPTKFNGGLFTFDPQYVKQEAEYRLSPDFRNWGGGVHTAQNQRLVYWPMLKNGDAELLRPQLDFYLNIYKNAEERSRLYWGHDGACLTEQIENYGLPCYAEYGTKRPEGFDPGMERNAWLEYEWDTCLEFCMMALEAHRYTGMDIGKYIPMVRSCLTFFDEHYQYLANMRGARRFNSNGKLVLYPGSGGETFKGAYNSTSTIAALQTVTRALMDYEREQGDTAALRVHGELLSRLPDITVRDGMIQPALHYERVQNTEPTQLYPVFPWRMYGVGREGLDIARNTYQDDSLAVKFRSHVGWKQDVIWAADLGMADEAWRLLQLKMANGPHRFPAFWGPGFDWTPDHNWGGSGMIGMQEMLLQEVGGRLYVFPAWPRSRNVKFRLHASHNTVVEGEMRDGRVVGVTVTPKERLQDVVFPE